jgi:hypothetical protein
MSAAIASLPQDTARQARRSEILRMLLSGRRGVRRSMRIPKFECVLQSVLLKVQLSYRKQN